MTIYFYQAMDKAGKRIEGDIEAPDHASALQFVRNRNFFPIKILERQPINGFAFKKLLPEKGFVSGVSQKDLMNFTQQLTTLMHSGMTLDRSLSISVGLSPNEKVRKVLTAVQKRVHSGSSFADALSNHPKTFSKIYVSMVRAGEMGGALDTVLQRLTDFIEKSEDFKNQIISAMIYPLILLGVGGLAFITMTTMIIPKFTEIFEDMGDLLPLSTVILIEVCGFLSHYWPVLLVFIGLTVLAFSALLKTEAGSYKWNDFVLRLPLFGDLVRKIEVSRFSRTMATLIKSGVPVLQSLLIVRGIINNRVIAAAMEKLHLGLKDGKGISQPLKKTNVFPPLAIHMIAVGEETGELDEMLIKVANTFDKEVENAIKRIIALIGPFMILFLAGLIGLMIIALLMGIFSINEMPL